MSRNMEDSNGTNLDALKRNLLSAINEAKNDPAKIENFVQILAQIMAQIIDRPLTAQQISYVTTRLSDNQEKTSVETGEGKAAAKMLLIAAEALLDKYKETFFQHSSVIQRDLENFQQFFENVCLNPQLKPTQQGAILSITSDVHSLISQVQITGRLGR